VNDIGDSRAQRRRWWSPAAFASGVAGSPLVVLLTDGFVVLPPIPPADVAGRRPLFLSVWTCQGGRRGR
jgi:hypothetical protein